MKYSLLIISYLLITSCAHKNSHKAKDANNWTEEHKKVMSDHTEAQSLFKWFSDHIEEHGKKISTYQLDLKQNQKDLKKLKVGLKSKRLKLEIGRKKEKMNEQHRHFLQDHRKFTKIIKHIKRVKKELESHEGHNH